MRLVRQVVAVAVLGGTFVALVATSRPVERGSCTLGHPEDRARYLVTSTCTEAYVAEVTLQAASCAVGVVPLDAGLLRTTGHATLDTLAQGGWAFDLATLEAPPDGGPATPGTRTCDVSRPDAGARALDFACEVFTVGACQDDPACRGLAACRGRLEPQP